MVTAAADAATGGTAGELVDVGGGNLLEVITELRRELRHVPEHVTQLELDRLPGWVVEDTPAVPKHLLDLVRHLAGLTAETQRRIDGVAAHLGIRGRETGSGLVSVDVDGCLPPAEAGFQTTGW